MKDLSICSNMNLFEVFYVIENNKWFWMLKSDLLFNFRSATSIWIFSRKN